MRSAETAGVATWTDPVRRGGASDWAGEQLAAVGTVRDGEAAQPHLHPWSTALRLPAGDGAVWLKALGRWAPETGIAEDLGRYGERCGRLTDGGVPATLQHDDLHDAIVLVSGDRHRFFDRGDASVGHPFVRLLVALRVAARALELAGGSPVLLRLRDGHLDVWREYGALAEPRERRAPALLVGPLQRALTWRRILRGVHADELPEWQGAVAAWTAEHLEAATLVPAGRRG